MLEWYFGLRPLVRFGVALIPLGIAALALASGRLWFWGWGIGAVMLIGAIPSHSDKNGGWGNW